MLSRLRRHNGFTLIELIVSILIMLLASGVLYYMIHQGEVFTEAEEHRAIALGLAENRMAAFKLLSDHEAVPTGTIRGEDTIFPAETENEEPDPIDASYTIDVVEENGLYTVTVTYEWVEYSGLDNHIVLVSQFLVNPMGM